MGEAMAEFDNSGHLSLDEIYLGRCEERKCEHIVCHWDDGFF